LNAVKEKILMRRKKERRNEREQME